jgi:hypothetical protein
MQRYQHRRSGDLRSRERRVHRAFQLGTHNAPPAEAPEVPSDWYYKLIASAALDSQNGPRQAGGLW